MQTMLGQIRSMAESERYDMLAWLVEMAYVEASDIIRGDRPPNVRQEEGHAPARVTLQPASKIKFQ